MKTLLILLSLVLSAYTSYAQSIEVIWEKKIVPDEKFLAISRDHKHLLTRKIDNLYNTILYLFEIKSKKLIDTILLKERIATTAEFSPDGSYIVCSDVFNNNWFTLKPNPLQIIKSSISNVHPSQNFYSIEKAGYEKMQTDIGDMLGKQFVKFDDNSDSTGWFTYRTPHTEFVSVTSKSLFQRVNWVTGKVINKFDVWAYPLTLETLPNQKGFTSLLLYESRSSLPGDQDTYSSESYIGLWKKDNDSLLYTRIEHKYLGTPQLTDKGLYLLYRNAILDITNQQAFMLNDTFSENGIVLAKSKYHIQFSGSTIFPFHLRSIRNIKKVYPVSTKFYQCTQLISCHDSSHFLSFSKDGILRLSRIDYKEGIPEEKFIADFNPTHPVIKSFDKVQFFNKSFPLQAEDTFQWDFGDGKTSTERDPIHQYIQAGEYTITLKVLHSTGNIDSTIKKNAIRVIFTDSNILKTKKIWNSRLSSIEYTPDGKNLICADSKNTFIVQHENLLVTDSILNDIHGVHAIEKEGINLYITIHKRKRTPLSETCPSPTNGQEVIFHIKMLNNLRDRALDSFIVLGKICDMDAGRVSEVLRTSKIYDSIFGLTYNSTNLVYTGPPSMHQKFASEAKKNINILKKQELIEFNEEIFNSHRPGKTQFVSPHYILSEKGLKDINTQKFISIFNFQNINDFAVIDGDHFLATTNDLVSTIILFNAKGDTLNIIRSATGAQISIDVNPINRNEFATTDYKGNVTIWKIPSYTDKPTGLVQIDFSADYIKNTVNKVKFTHEIFPFRQDGIIEWNFGDGKISNEISPAHTYEQPGVYSVSMRYTTPHGIDTTIVKNNIVVIKLIPHIIDFSVSQSTIKKNDTVSFNNLTNPFTNNFYYIWDFGDGTTSNEVHPNHTYSQYGIFTVTLTVKGSGMSDTTIRKIQFIEVKPVLKVHWHTIPSQLAIGDTLHSELDIDPKDFVADIEWDFGDSKLHEQSIKYVYPIPIDTIRLLGQKKISLKVQMDSSIYKEERVVSIVPKIKLLPSYAEVFEGTQNAFYAKILPASTTYNVQWVWGDSTNTENAFSSQHIYKQAGLYTILFTLSELHSGISTSVQATVTVKKPNSSFYISSLISDPNTPITFYWYGSIGTLTIHSLRGELIRQFEYTGEPSPQNFVWDITDQQHNRLAPGLYYCTLNDKYGNTITKPVFILY